MGALRLGALVSASLTGTAFAADVPRTAPDWRSVGPFGGTATALAVDPKNPKILLAGSRNSLLFKSDDAGAGWQALPFPKRAFGEVTSILTDPQDEQHYLVGLVGSDGPGLYESRDGGSTWSAVHDLGNVGVRALASAPADPARFAAATLSGVFLTADSGAHWTRISDSDNPEMQGVTAVAFDAKDSNVIYAGTTHLPWRTTDGGKTWTSIHTGMIDDSDVFSIFVDPRAPERVLASACSGIYASADRGEQWRKLLGIPNTHRRTHVIRQDPAGDGTIYAGTTLGLFRSTDSGATWKQLSQEQVNSLAFDPATPGRLYLALEDEGIWTSPDRGTALQALNQGFASRWMNDLTWAGRQLLAVDAEGVLFVSSDGTAWTQPSHVTGLDRVHLRRLAGAAGESLLLGGSAQDLYKSIDSGTSWKPLPIMLTVVTKTAAPTQKTRPRTRGRAPQSAASVARTKTVQKPFSVGAIHRLLATKGNEAAYFFAATNRGLLRSADKGQHWTLAEIPASGEIFSVYAAENSAGQVVARGAEGLYVSTDFGEHWKPATFPIDVKRISDIAMPSEPSRPMLAATLQGLYASSDDGQTWQTVTDGLPLSTANSVIYEPIPNGAAYVVEFGELFRSADGLHQWTRLPTHLQQPRIRHLWMTSSLTNRLFGLTSDVGILFRDQGLIQ